MRVQFPYIKPIMLAILNDEYPACSSHARFFQGQKARQETMKNQHLTGSLGEDVADALGKYLRRWALGADFGRVRECAIDHDDAARAFEQMDGDPLAGSYLILVCLP